MNFQTLISPENKQQRSFIEDNGVIWLHLSDLCRNLGYQNATQQIDNMNLRCWTKQMSDGSKGYPPLWIREEGAYLLMFEANTLEALNTKRWLATKVLPELRKTGKYELKTEDVQHFEDLGLSITEKAQKQIEALLDQMANSTHDPLAVNRYANAIQTLNDVLHRNQKISDSSSLENIENYSNSIKQFLDDHVEKTDNQEYQLAASKLYKAYCVFCKKKKYRIETQTAFGLEAVKIANKKRTAKGVFYFGITLK